MQACIRGDSLSVMYHVEQGCDINKVSQVGTTALMLSAAFGYYDISVWLVENGADTDLRDNTGKLASDLVLSSAQLTFQASINALAAAQLGFQVHNQAFAFAQLNLHIYTRALVNTKLLIHRFLRSQEDETKTD